MVDREANSPTLDLSAAPRLLQIFNRYLDKGGEETWVEKMSSLLGRDYEISDCVFDSRDWTGASAPRAWDQALRMFYNPTSIGHLRELTKSFRPQAWLVHNVFPVGSAAVYREALRLQIPIIQYVHNFRPFSVNGYLWAGDSLATGGLKRRFWREIAHGAWQGSRAKTAWLGATLTAMHQLRWFRGVKAWIAISDFMRQRFIEAGIPSKDIFTLRHCWQPINESPTFSEKDYYLFLGRLIPAKGVEVLLQAWNILHAKKTDNAPRLVIAGEGPLEHRVRHATKENPLVEFHGLVAGNDKAALLSQCRAVIAPSLWWEPLGLVTYEAYDYAKPMLAARSGGLTETVVDGATGYLHEPGNAAGLAGHVLKLEADTGLRHSLGMEGRKWLLENTGPQNWVEGFRHIVNHSLRANARRV